MGKLTDALVNRILLAQKTSLERENKTLKADLVKVKESHEKEVDGLIARLDDRNAELSARKAASAERDAADEAKAANAANAANAASASNVERLAERLTESQQRLAESEQRYVASEQRHTESQQRLAESEQRYAASEQRYATSLAASEQRYAASKASLAKCRAELSAHDNDFNKASFAKKVDALIATMSRFPVVEQATMFPELHAFPIKTEEDVQMAIAYIGKTYRSWSKDVHPDMFKPADAFTKSIITRQFIEGNAIKDEALKKCDTILETLRIDRRVAEEQRAAKERAQRAAEERAQRLRDANNPYKKWW